MRRRAAPCVLLFPQVRRAREIVANGELGSVFTARGHGQGGVPPWEGYISDPSPYFARGGRPLRGHGRVSAARADRVPRPGARGVSAISARTRDSFDIVDGPMAGTRDSRRGDRQLAPPPAPRTARSPRGGEQLRRRRRSRRSSSYAASCGALGVSLLDVSEPLRLQWPARTGPRSSPRALGRPRSRTRRRAPGGLRRGGTAPTLNVAHAGTSSRCSRRRACRPPRGAIRRRRLRLPEGGFSLEEGAPWRLSSLQAPFRIGVVGVGALALRGILPHLTQPDVADRVSSQALCDPVEERARGAAERFGVPKVSRASRTCSAAAMSMRSRSRRRSACTSTTAAWRSRRELHVHVNKTLSTTVAEADDADRARPRSRPSARRLPRRGAAAAANPHARAHRVGAIGDVAWAICGGAFETYHESEEPERLEAPGGLPINPAWYFRKPGGGPMYDITVYALHQLTSVLGPAQRVTALSGIRVPHRSSRGSASRRRPTTTRSFCSTSATECSPSPSAPPPEPSRSSSAPACTSARAAPSTACC